MVSLDVFHFFHLFSVSLQSLPVFYLFLFSFFLVILSPFIAALCIPLVFFLNLSSVYFILVRLSSLSRLLFCLYRFLVTLLFLSSSLVRLWSTYYLQGLLSPFFISLSTQYFAYTANRQTPTPYLNVLMHS